MTNSWNCYIFWSAALPPHFLLLFVCVLFSSCEATVYVPYLINSGVRYSTEGRAANGIYLNIPCIFDSRSPPWTLILHTTHTQISVRERLTTPVATTYPTVWLRECQSIYILHNTEPKKKTSDSSYVPCYSTLTSFSHCLIHNVEVSPLHKQNVGWATLF